MKTPPYTRERLIALSAVDKGDVFRVPSRPWMGRPGKMTRPGWLSTTHPLSSPVCKALEEALSLGYLDTSRGPGIAVSLNSAGRSALHNWERSALWDRDAPTV